MNKQQHQKDQKQGHMDQQHMAGKGNKQPQMDQNMSGMHQGQKQNMQGNKSHGR